jgi:hypothetical protein
MLPILRPGDVFPRPCTDYTSHLGSRQAQAFSLLWNLHAAADPMMDADHAAWYIHQANVANDDLLIAPRHLRQELFDATTHVVTNYRRPGPFESITSQDITYIELFPIIAGWQHEIIEQNMAAFIGSLYER